VVLAAAEGVTQVWWWCWCWRWLLLLVLLVLLVLFALVGMVGETMLVLMGMVDEKVRHWRVVTTWRVVMTCTRRGSAHHITPCALAVADDPTHIRSPSRNQHHRAPTHQDAHITQSHNHANTHQTHYTHRVVRRSSVSVSSTLT
jgi:hypothetical protein